MERLLSICGPKITEARQSSILNVRSLFKELESNDWLGIDCLDTLKEILNQTNENNLLKEVEEFEQRQNHELKSERLSPPEAPAGYPHQNKIIEKNRKRAGDDSHPSHRAPRALFFFIPSLPTTQKPPHNTKRPLRRRERMAFTCRVFILYVYWWLTLR